MSKNLPELKKITSDWYGEYNVRCIGIVRHMEIIKHFREKGEVNGYNRWMDEFFPLNFFSLYAIYFEVIENEKLKPYEELHDLYDLKFYVATLEDNKDWCFKETKYYKSLPVKKRKLSFPASVPIDMIEKWQKSLPENLIGLNCN